MMGIRAYLRNVFDRLLYRKEIDEKLGQLAAQLRASNSIGLDMDKAMQLCDNRSINQKLEALAERIQSIENDAAYVDKGTQILMGIRYREMLSRGELLPFEDVDFRNHSQTGEDGILWYIFSLIGTRSKKSIEICAGNGKECNSANLIINHGWHSLLVDGNESRVAIAEQYFRAHPNTRLIPPRVICDWVTAENVNKLISTNGFSGEVDLLSLDMDGVDFWIWKAIADASPRVVVLEVQAIWGCDRAVTVPYRPDFRLKVLGDKERGIAWYAGASLAAFVKLAREKGYRLIGSNRFGFNALFMRNDVGAGIFPEVPPAQAFNHPVVAWTNGRLRPLYDDDNLDWIDV